MKLSTDEYVDYGHLCVLETLLEKSIEFQRLNLPSRDKLLGEVKGGLRRLEKLDHDRRMANRSYATEPLDEVPAGVATREPGDEL
jgi:hypothetical protein